MKRFRLNVALVAALLLGLAFKTIAQFPPTPPLSTAANAPYVKIENPTNGAAFSAHSDVTIDVFVAMKGADKRDAMRLEFYANANRIGKATAKWHPEIRPPQIGNQATPMWIRPSGFDPVEFVWKNPPPGNYSLTVKAVWKKSSVLSTNINVTVAP